MRVGASVGTRGNLSRVLRRPLEGQVELAERCCTIWGEKRSRSLVRCSFE